MYILSNFCFYSYHTLSRKKCYASKTHHMSIGAVSLLEPMSRRRNADCEISIVWADRSGGKKEGVACNWRI